MKKALILSFCITFLFSTFVFSQDNNDEEKRNVQPIQLKGTHSISLQAGYQDVESQVSYISPGRITADPPFMGLLSYQYWTGKKSALSFSTGILQTETHARYSRTFSKATIPLVIGYHFYPNNLSWGNIGRGYFGLNVGTYIETNSGVNRDSNNSGAETYTEVKMGADLHAGVDFFPTDFIRVGPRLAWHSSEYFQGAVISLTLGVLL